MAKNLAVNRNLVKAVEKKLHGKGAARRRARRLHRPGFARRYAAV